MGRLAIVEENGQAGPPPNDSNSESGRIPEAVNNNSAAATAGAASTSSSAVESENAKRKAGNSDESGYLSEKGPFLYDVHIEGEGVLQKLALLGMLYSK